MPGAVRGFAVVHCLGILTSMFSAVLVSRGMVNLVFGARRIARRRTPYVTAQTLTLMAVQVLPLFLLPELLLPWLDHSPVKSIRYKGPLTKVALALFVIAFFVLGYLGTLSVTQGRTIAAQVFTVVYFAFFLLMHWYTRMDKTKPEPDRVTWGGAH